MPVIAPRVSGVHMLLESFQPIHGVLLCEGEDIDPSLYDSDELSQEEVEEIKKLHSSDTTIDREKDSIELALAKLCLERNIPYLGICRGSQVLNVACGGTLYQDLEKELSKRYQMLSRSDTPEMSSLMLHPCLIGESDMNPSGLLECLNTIEKELSKDSNSSEMSTILKSCPSDTEKESSENYKDLFCSDSSEMSDMQPSTILKSCPSDIERELPNNCSLEMLSRSSSLKSESQSQSRSDIGKKYEKVVHMNYENYDGHRHVVKIVENTPLHKWFKESLEDNNDDEKMEIWVNSYHHQGVKRLAQRFVPMAFANDGLIEGFYDPDAYNPEEGKFIMGLQFHPERMRGQDNGDFDYPGCAMAYQVLNLILSSSDVLSSSHRCTNNKSQSKLMLCVFSGSMIV